MDRFRWRHGLLLISLCGAVLLLALTRPLAESTVTIDWNTTYQTIDGFGASATGYTQGLSAAQADRFFSPATGLGLSLLRTRVIPDTMDADCGCVANSTPYACVAGPKSEIVSGDLETAQLAAARGVRLFAAPWSPPAQMKSSGKYCSSGSFLGNATNYDAYAAILASFPPLLKAHGLTIDALSVQNEPDIANPAYDTCTWTAQQMRDFVPYLSKALRAAGYGNVKIAIPEETGWSFASLAASMDDPAVAADVGLILSHAYGVPNPQSVPSQYGLHVWQSEVSGSSAYDGSMSDAMTWARSLHSYMSVGANAWMFWSLDCGKKQFNAGNNMCLTDQSGHLAKRAYVLGQYAKFVRPGWQRIEVTNSGSLLVTAYRGPGEQFAILATNPSRWAAREQEFQFRGARSHQSPVTPWLTSAGASLARQSAVLFTEGGTAFTYKVPANTVVTLQGKMD